MKSLTFSKIESLNNLQESEKKELKEFLFLEENTNHNNSKVNSNKNISTKNSINDISFSVSNLNSPIYNKISSNPIKKDIFYNRDSSFESKDLPILKNRSIKNSNIVYNNIDSIPKEEDEFNLKTNCSLNIKSGNNMQNNNIDENTFHYKFSSNILNNIYRGSNNDNQNDTNPYFTEKGKYNFFMVK